MLSGCLSWGCVPKGYSSHAYPIVQEHLDRPNDNTSAIIFSSFLKNDYSYYDPYEQYPYEKFGPVTFHGGISYNGESYYVECFMDLKKQDEEYIEHWKYTVCKSNSEYIGTLTSDIAKGAMFQKIRICFLDEQYIYYMCENTIKVKDSLAHHGFQRYYRYAFFRFNLETYENEEITLSMLFEKLVPIHKEFLLEQERSGYPVYDIKINPEYKGYKGKYNTGEKS